MSKLLEELRTLPAFNAFEKAVNEKLTSENSYVEHFMPEVGEYWDEAGYDEDGKREWQRCYTSEEQAEEKGINELLEDKSGYFDEFVRDELGSEVSELVRALIKEMRG